MNNIDKLDSFTKQYLITALWSSIGDNEEPLDKHYSISDFDSSAISHAIRDCKSFQLQIPGNIEVTDTFAHDFWLTRNHHGAGFWDGDYPKELGQALTGIAHTYPELNPIVGDDGKIYFY